MEKREYGKTKKCPVCNTEHSDNEVLSRGVMSLDGKGACPVICKICKHEFYVYQSIFKENQ